MISKNDEFSLNYEGSNTQKITLIMGRIHSVKYSSICDKYHGCNYNIAANRRLGSRRNNL